MIRSLPIHTGVGQLAAVGRVKDSIQARQQIRNHPSRCKHRIRSEQEWAELSAVHHRLMQLVVIAAVLQGLPAQGIQRFIAHAAIGQGSPLPEKGREIKVGRQPYLPQVKVKISRLQGLCVGFPVQSTDCDLESTSSQAVRYRLGCRNTERIVTAHQEGRSCILQSRLGERARKHSGVISI